MLHFKIIQTISIEYGTGKSCHVTGRQIINIGSMYHGQNNIMFFLLFFFHILRCPIKGQYIISCVACFNSSNSSLKKTAEIEMGLELRIK